MGPEYRKMLKYRGFIVDSKSDLAHYGIKGMKRGVRRYTNEDGSLNAAGKARYGYGQQPESNGGTNSRVGSMGIRKLSANTYEAVNSGNKNSKNRPELASEVKSGKDPKLNAVQRWMKRYTTNGNQIEGPYPLLRSNNKLETKNKNNESRVSNTKDPKLSEKEKSSDSHAKDTKSGAASDRNKDDGRLHAPGLKDPFKSSQSVNASDDKKKKNGKQAQNESLVGRVSKKLKKWFSGLFHAEEDMTLDDRIMDALRVIDDLLPDDVGEDEDYDESDEDSDESSEE